MGCENMDKLKRISRRNCFRIKHDPELRELYKRIEYVVIDKIKENWKIIADGKESI